MKPDFTKMYIAEAYKNLLKERAYSEVTIRSIVETCEINRKTFYYHFFNVADLATYIFRSDLAEALRSEFSEDEILANPENENDKYRMMPLYYKGNPNELHARFFGVFSDVIKRQDSFYRKLFNSADWGYFNDYVFSVYKPHFEQDLRFRFNDAGVMLSEEEIDYLSSYLTNNSVIWVFHRHVTKRSHFSSQTKANLSRIILDGVEGIVSGQVERLNGLS